MQIIAGVLNLVTGFLFITSGIHDHIMMFNMPFWLGGVVRIILHSDSDYSFASKL